MIVVHTIFNPMTLEDFNELMKEKEGYMILMYNDRMDDVEGFNAVEVDDELKTITFIGE